MFSQPSSRALHRHLDHCIQEALPYLAECAESLKVEVHEISRSTEEPFARVEISVELDTGRSLRVTADDADHLIAVELAFGQLELEMSLHKRGLLALLTRERSARPADARLS